MHLGVQLSAEFDKIVGGPAFQKLFRALGKACENAHFLLLQDSGFPAAGDDPHGVFPAEPAEYIRAYFRVLLAFADTLLRTAYERLLGNDELLDALYAYPGAGGNAKGTVLLHAEIYIFDGLARQLVEHLAAVGEFKGSHSRMYFLISG